MIKIKQIKTERYSKQKITLRQLVNLYPKIKVDYYLLIVIRVLIILKK